MSLMVIRSESPGATTAVPSCVFADRRLEYEHVGLYLYWLAQGSPERLDLDEARENGGIGRDKLYRLIRELREYGYLPTPQPVEGPRLNPRDWDALRMIVFERDGYICVYCDERCPSPHCDHVVPISRGGTNEIENLATACPPCNLSKGDKLLSEWKGRTS